MGKWIYRSTYSWPWQLYVREIIFGSRNFLGDVERRKNVTPNEI
jgi:hypothetical protein